MSVTALASLLVGPITELLGKVIKDKDKAAAMAHEIATLSENQAHKLAELQIEVNKEEAKSPSLFVAGWRPFIGWACGVIIVNNYIIVPYAVAAGLTAPILDLSEMMPVLLGMLGLGTMRAYEKKNGVARENMRRSP